MKFRQIDSLSSISVSNPANHSKVMIQNIHPTMVKITLGVLIAPNGDGIAQLERTLSKAREFYGDFKHSSMNEKSGWLLTMLLSSPFCTPFSTVFSMPRNSPP
jgi:hypothetical protein